MEYMNFLKLNTLGKSSRKFLKIFSILKVLVFPRNSYVNWERRESSQALEGYLVSVTSETNEFLYSYISKLDYSTLLEVGSNVGNRIINLAKLNPTKHFFGIDINKSAINLGNNYLISNRINNLSLHVSNLVKLEAREYSADIVLTWATLIYISPREIRKAIYNLAQLSKNYIILVEKVIDHDCSIFNQLAIQIKGFPNWSYNYEALLKKHGFKLIQKDSIPTEIWLPGGGGAEILIFKKESF